MRPPAGVILLPGVAGSWLSVISPARLPTPLRSATGMHHPQRRAAPCRSAIAAAAIACRTLPGLAHK